MTIPASQFVKVNPGVLAPGGSNLVLNGLFLTENLAMPTGEVLSFAAPSAVSAFFGPNSAETAAAQIYFLGYNNSSVKPSAMLFAAYNAAARAAFMNSGSFANMTLAQMQALGGVLTLSVNGTPITSSTISLTGVTTQSLMAAAIQAAFTTPPFTVTWNAVTSQFVITSSTTGSASTITFATGTGSAELLFTQATGAILSQGAVVDTPGSAMVNAYASSQNWETMVTLFEPALANKELFAAWFNAQNDEFLYLAWASDVQASVANATEPFGVVALAAQYAGVACIGGDPLAVPAGNTLAAMVMDVAIFLSGAIASLNFAQNNGRTTMAFLSGAGLLPTCAALQTSVNLLANGYSYYGAVATRNNGFVFFYNGNMPGTFSWIDTFVDDAWMQDQFQVALLTLATTAGSVPYNPAGYGLIRAALGAPIAKALNYGAIRPGVTLSALQIAEVTGQAGQDISVPLQNQGWYLQVLDPGATVRAARGTPVINFWYTDGGAVQQFTMDSIDIL